MFLLVFSIFETLFQRCTQYEYESNRLAHDAAKKTCDNNLKRISNPKNKMTKLSLNPLKFYKKTRYDGSATPVQTQSTSTGSATAARTADVSAFSGPTPSAVTAPDAVDSIESIVPMTESIADEAATEAFFNSLPPSPVMSTDEIVIEGLNESAIGPAVPVFAADTSNNMATDEMSNEIDNGQAGRRVKITKHSISELRERLRRNPVTMGWGFKHALNANLSEHIKFREKEITLISGQTGSGKTSVTVQWALDFCMQGFQDGYFLQEIDVEHLLGN